MDYESRIIFSGELIQMGEWKCHPDSNLWGEENRLHGPFPTIVFPRSAVQIQHTGRELFVTSQNQVVFYNKSQTYRRGLASRIGDICDYVYVDAKIIAEIQSSLGIRHCDDLDAPFTQSQGPCSTRVFLVQRSLSHLIAKKQCEPLLIEESFLSVLPNLLADSDPANGNRNVARPPTVEKRILQTELVKEYLVKNLSNKVSLNDVARFSESSVYHICRVFKQHTGFSIFQFLMSLRLRRAFEHVIDSKTALTQIAIECGFSSHSHLTNLFRREFGFSPALLRRRRPKEIIQRVLRR